MSALDKFGEFLIVNLRDKAIEQHDMLLRGELRGKLVRNLQEKVSRLSDEQKQLVREVVVDVLDTALHDLLFSIQDAHDRGLKIEIIIDGENIAQASGMLHGEHLGEGGWIDRFSRYGLSGHQVKQA